MGSFCTLDISLVDCFHVEDVKASEVLHLSKSHLSWFIDQLSELLSGSINHFFLNNGQGEFGAARFSKLRSNSGCMLNVLCGQCNNIRSHF